MAAKPQILTQENVVSHLIEMVSPLTTVLDAIDAAAAVQVSTNLFSCQRVFTQSEPSEDEEPLLDPAYVHTQVLHF